MTEHDSSTGGRPFHRIHPAVNWVLVLFGVIIVGAFAVVAIRSDYNAQNIKRTQQQNQISQEHDHTAQQALCAITNANTKHTNDLIDSLITAVEATTSLPASEKARRIATYQQSKGSLTPCN